MSVITSYKPASLMRRLFAVLLDGVLIGLFGTVLLVVASKGWTDPSGEGVYYAIVWSFPALLFTEIFGFPVALTLAILLLQSYGQVGPTADRVCVLIVLISIPLLPLLISSIIYHGLMESSPTKATVGKLIMGIFVSDLNGNKISFMRAMFRYLARGLSTLTCGLGYLMALGKTGQALHDKITGCIVLSKE